MSLANLLRYNFRVVKIEHAFRGILTITSLLVIVLLMAASNWAPLNRLLHSSQTAQNSGDISTASILFAHAAKYSPSKFELIEKAGLLARKAGDSASARSYLLQVQESSLLSPAGLIVLGDISYEAGLADEAINYWEAANELEKNEETYAKLVRAYRQTGDWEQAIHAQKELVNLNQYNAAANYQIGLMLAASDPNSSLAYLSLAGELDKSLKKVTQPLARSLRSAANRGDPAYPFMIAGQELAAIDEWELAQLAFTNAARLDISSADALAYLGEALQHTGQGGYSKLEEAIELDPRSIPANTFMALFWQRQERYDLALVYLYAAVALDEENPALQAEIGNTLALMGNFPAAESHYQLATRLDPRNSTYWNALADYYIRYELNIEEKGAAAARQAVILTPGDPRSLDILAQIYLLQESPILAERFLERALAANAQYAPAHLHFGLVNILEGDRLEAYQHFSAALRLSQPGSSTHDQAQRLLQTYFP